MKLPITGLLALLPVGLALAQVPTPGAPSCHNCTFSDYLDLGIDTDHDLTPASQDSCCAPYLLGVLVPAGETKAVAPSATDEGGQSFLLSKAIGWSAWSTRRGLLSWYLPHDAHHGLIDTRPLATRLPSADGRLLYLVGGDATEWPLLVEFRGALFRYVELGYDARASVKHQFYHHPDADLLVLTITDGSISKIYNTETTWLSVLDLRRDRWLLDTVVESYDNDSWSTQRFYQVKDAGRTVVLGPYRDDKKRYQYATLPRGKDRPQSTHDLPPGTYHLLAGRYQPAKATTPPNRPAVPAAPHRLAVSAAEVNGTYRDAQGRELAVLAQGGGRVRVAFRGPLLRPHGLLDRRVMSAEGIIAADTAAALLKQPEDCTLRLHFEQPGTLRVREHGPGCLAEAVGTYQKVSAEKPVLR